MAKAIEIEAARREILARVRPLPVEEVGLDAALGRRLAADAVADAPSQPFDNSAMDGFAVRAADVATASPDAPAALEVVAESRAGHPATRGLGPGEAIAISTGAMLPAGADAVVRVEDTERGDDARPGTRGRRDADADAASPAGAATMAISSWSARRSPPARTSAAPARTSPRARRCCGPGPSSARPSSGRWRRSASTPPRCAATLASPS